MDLVRNLVDSVMQYDKHEAETLKAMERFLNLSDGNYYLEECYSQEQLEKMYYIESLMKNINDGNEFNALCIQEYGRILK